MKTKKFLVIVPLAIMLAVTMTSCGGIFGQFLNWVGISKHHEYSAEGPNDPDVLSFPATVINYGLGGKLTPEGLSYIENGKNFTVYAELEFGGRIDSLKINDKKVSLSLMKGNTYSFPVDMKYKVEGFFSRTLSWTIIQGKWRLDTLLVLKPDGWKSIPQWGVPGQRQEIYTFYSTGKFQIVNDKGNKWGDPQSWNIDETKKPVLLLIGNGTLKSVAEIENLDNARMVWANYNVPNADPTIPPGAQKLIFSNIK